MIHAYYYLLCFKRLLLLCEKSFSFIHCCKNNSRIIRHKSFLNYDKHYRITENKRMSFENDIDPGVGTGVCIEISINIINPN